MSKVCSKCGGSGPFGQDKQSKDGLSNRCKACAILNTKKWRAKNIANPQLNPNKKCSACGSTGPFYHQRGTKDGLTTKCIVCCNERPSRQKPHTRKLAAERRKNNPEHFRAKDARERIKYADRRKDNWYSWAYGLQPGEKQKLIDAQGGKCAICQDTLKPKYTDVDHDHKTSKIRGILCRSCNNLIGIFKDNPQSLANAIIYLTSSQVVFPVMQQHKVSTKDKVQYHRRYFLFTKYGITLEQFEWLYEKQQHKCAICFNAIPSLGGKCHIDHVHGTKVIRGLLCNSCNIGLGQARENAPILQNAIVYLVQNQL